MKLSKVTQSLSLLLVFLAALPTRLFNSLGEWTCDHFHERYRGWPNSGTQVCFKCHRVRKVEWGSPDVYRAERAGHGRSKAGR